MSDVLVKLHSLAIGLVGFEPTHKGFRVVSTLPLLPLASLRVQSCVFKDGAYNGPHLYEGAASMV